MQRGMKWNNRVIGRFKGHEEGPLLIAIGGLHGNEKAGVNAISIMLKMLEVEPLANPRFRYRGNFLGIIGNLRALQSKKRFLSKDINRSFTEENVEKIFESDFSELMDEDREIYELIQTIKDEIVATNSEKVYLLDLHTTTAFGGIFTIPSDDAESVEIARQLHAPVILGFMEYLNGTTLQYFRDETLGIPTTAVTFEAGQHDDYMSVHRGVSAIAGYMRSINSVKESDVESHHDDLLIESSVGLPKLCALFYAHPIKPGDDFKMKPGYENFQAVAKDEVLASDRQGELKAQEDGMILMPLYQAQGEDGYFLIKEVSASEVKHVLYDMEQFFH